jgi:hypothetical protein
MQTTSDWTTVRIVGAKVTRPLRVASSGKVLQADFDGSQFVLTQSLPDANAGRSVTVTFDLLLSGITARSTVSARIERGDLGKTTVTLYNYLRQRPVQVASTTSSLITGNPEPHHRALAGAARHDVAGRRLFPRPTPHGRRTCRSDSPRCGMRQTRHASSDAGAVWRTYDR